jgi:hypothetical protein
VRALSFGYGYYETPVGREFVTDGDRRNDAFFGRGFCGMSRIDNESAVLEDTVSDARTYASSECACVFACRLDAVYARNGFKHR